MQTGVTSADTEAHYLVGKAMQETIENKIPEGPVKELNKYIGQHLEAIRQLENLHGTTASGKMSGYFARSIGAIAGSHAGPGGTIAGAQMGKKVSEIASEFNANNPFVMNTLLQQSKKDPAVVGEFAKYLEHSMTSPTVQTNAAGVLENLATKLPARTSPLVTALPGAAPRTPTAPTKLNIRDIDAERAAAWAAKQAKSTPQLVPLKKNIPITPAPGGLMNK
jgi:hypothetical protein